MLISKESDTDDTKSIVNKAAQRRPNSRIEKLSKKPLVTLTSLKEFVILTKLKIRCTERAHNKTGCHLITRASAPVCHFQRWQSKAPKVGGKSRRLGNGFTCWSSSSQT